MTKLIKFYSPTCGPCKVLEKNLKDAEVDYIDVDITSEGDVKELNNLKVENVLMHFKIRTVPTLIKIDNKGNELERKVGIVSVEQIKEMAYGKND